MYWLVGNRQTGGVHITSEGEVTQYVRSSLERAKFESGGNNSPHLIKQHPRMANLMNEVGESPALQLGRMTAKDATFLQSKFGGKPYVVFILVACIAKEGIGDKQYSFS